MNFLDMGYLQRGTERQREVYRVLRSLRVFDLLEAFSPCLAGTIPLGIDTPQSDLDILCCYGDKGAFVKALRDFENRGSYQVKVKDIRGEEAIICRFYFEGFCFEIFGQAKAVEDQMAYRHMVKEYEILEREAPSFKDQIIQLKNQGLKTEPAFAQLLGLEGDPYLALLEYEG